MAEAAPNALSSLSADEKARFAAIQELPFAEQAKRFLNVFWNGGPGTEAGQQVPAMSEKAEEVWTIVFDVFKELEKLESNAGDDRGQSLSIDESGQRLLDKMRTLELWDAELNLQGLSKEMSKYDIDGDSRMSVAEFLLFFYKADLQTLANGNFEEKPEEAEYQAASAEFEEWDKKYPPLQKSVDELTAAQDAWKAKIAKLEAATTDESVSAVKRGRAVTDLRAAKEEEPIADGTRIRQKYDADVAKVASYRESWTKAKTTLDALTHRLPGIPGSHWWDAKAKEESAKAGPGGGSKLDTSRFES